MPLTERDRRFLETVDRLKIYLLLLAFAVFLSLLMMPSSQFQTATSVIGVALCGVFWLTQRLLTLLTRLDFELTRAVNSLRRSLPEQDLKEFLRSP